MRHSSVDIMHLWLITCTRLQRALSTYHLVHVADESIRCGEGWRCALFTKLRWCILFASTRIIVAILYLVSIKEPPTACKRRISFE